ncbi:MAG: hypothetical protein VX153_07960 [Verrucomicrobiota bacterium]|nr:hypothetical protein [Verrucomicrobiota bacterium]
MSLNKKERRISIWIGIAIGVACSSMIVRYALKHKENQISGRPGNYESNTSASSQSIIPSLPEDAQKKIPNGIVVYHEFNQSITEDPFASNSWVVETSGNFRSERLFILVEQNNQSDSDLRFFRASEIYARLKPTVSKKKLESFLNQDEYRIIGKNSKTDEFIIQIKKIRPSEIRNTLRFFKKEVSIFNDVRVPIWASN